MRTVPVVALLFCQAAFTQEAPIQRLSYEKMEEFLRTATIKNHKGLNMGVTNSERATLESGALVHDAHIQSIDMHSSSYQTQRGTELNFKDSYKFNIAAYRLARLLSLDMVPVSIERKAAGKTAAVTWWVDNTSMTELDRTKKHVEPPDLNSWNCQMNCVRVFDQLIYNTDRNLGNLVIDKDWKLWMIDHTRAFRNMTTLANPKNLTRCDRKLLEALRGLDEQMLAEQTKGYLNGMEVKGVMARRDKIVQFFDSEIASKGEAAVLFDLPH